MSTAALAEVLPAVNASLNAASGVLLLVGLVAIRRGRVALHRRCMLGAFSLSVLFLLCYLVRVALTGTHRFPAEGVVRAIYLLLLTSHMLLAAVLPWLAVRAIQFGLLGRLDEHRRTVRYAWPIWMYVSATGILVYVWLYHASG
ncbi:MAG: DUF420 domain-containing protein [Myxococcales bacterium]|nr:DUF420 domain-containing protein [Myxococcota bacterium]MDW8284127.1 DUF420 domain-containing protein [Myxococcales bacterium]